jgi:hypothetical protein
MKQLFLFLCGAILLSIVDTALGQGTAFFYQGQLTANGAPANGRYDLTFTLLNAGGPVTGPVENPATAVSNGLFSVALDFGPGVFNGSNLWLQIGVRSNGTGAFTALAPTQPVLAMPYAILADTADNLSGPLPGGQLSGTYPGNINLDNGSNRFAGSFAGDGSGLANVNAAWLNGLAGSNYATLDALTSYATLDTLTNYATLDSLTNVPGVSSIPNMQVFNSVGTSQFIVPAGVTRIAVEVWGGGGGGGNATNNTPEPAGAGGGAGGYGKGVFAVTPGDGYTVVVGAGGGPAGPGGASSFGSLISAGGGSAGANGPYSLGGAGGAGGTSSAPVNIAGGAGQWTSAPGGSYGGSAGNGGSGGTGDTGSVSGSGQVPGGGGGGGFDLGDAGGAGGQGRVIIYY